MRFLEQSRWISIYLKLSNNFVVPVYLSSLLLEQWDRNQVFYIYIYIYTYKVGILGEKYW